LAAGTSMLSTPVPARPTTRSRGAAASSAAVTFVALRTSSASASARSAARRSGARPERASTVQPGSARRRSTAEAGRSSAITIFMRGQASPATSARASAAFRSDRADVVDDVPDLVLGQLAAVRFHAGLRRAVVNDLEDLAVGRSVLPVGVGQVGRLRVQLFAHASVAFAAVAVAARAVLVEDGLAGGNGRRVRGHGIGDLRGVGVPMGAGFVLMLLRRGKRQRQRPAERRGEERVPQSWMTHGYSIIRRFCSPWTTRPAVDTPCDGANR